MAQPAESREQRRSRRKRPVRARTIAVYRLSKREIELGQLAYPEQPGVDYERPRTRAECKDGPRPCPYVSCYWHLYLDVSPDNGSIKLNFPDLEPGDMVHSCALDVADMGGASLEHVGAVLNIVRERVRQVEVVALAKVQAAQDTMALRDFASRGASGKRRLPVLP